MKTVTRYEQHEFTKRFRSAVAEGRLAITSRLSNKSSLVFGHYDYPTVTYSENGFPRFSSSGFDSGPRDYGRILSELGKFNPENFFDGPIFDPKEFPAIAELANWVEQDRRFREYFTQPTADDKSSYWGWSIRHMLVSTIDHSIHRYGTIEIGDDEIGACARPVERGVFLSKLPISIVVPICLTGVDASHFDIGLGAYLFRMANPTQIARSKVSYYGSGAPDSVVASATHAIALRDWHIDNENYGSTTSLLYRPSAFPSEAIDRVFTAIRMSTGIETGYAQMLFVPRGWSLGYKADLNRIYGATCRKYPAYFDDFWWNKTDIPRISRPDLDSIKRNYKLIVARNENRVTIASRRLNACMTRDDVEDAIIDATIGLEVLLGDDDAQAISYKLRMRAAALASLPGTGKLTPQLALDQMAQVYRERSSIVHGSSGRKERKEISNSLEKRKEVRRVASDLLRGILEILVHHPQFLNPSEIDKQLLVRA